MYRYWQAQNGIKTGFFGILRRKFRRVLTVLPKFENLRSGACPSGGEAFIIRFTSRRKEVKPLTEGGRAVLVLFVTASAASDLRRGRIYNFLTFPTMAAGVLLLMLNTPQEIPPVLGAMTAAMLLLFPFWKAGGLGAGDIKLLMALAPFMGPGWFLFGTVLSFLIGAGISAFLLIRYRDLSRTVHFAVPIGISVMLCLLLEQLGIQSPSLVTF